MSNMMLYVLGESLAQATGKNETLCRGLLRLTVMDSVEPLRQTPDPNQAMAYMKTMAFEDWKAIIEGAVLSQRLANIRVAKPDDVVARLRQTLVEKQSLLTMTA